MAINHITVIPPNYIGSYFVEFMDGSARLLSLIGSSIDGTGRPIYIYDDEGNVYNFQNVISVKRKTRTTNG